MPQLNLRHSNLKIVCSIEFPNPRNTYLDPLYVKIDQETQEKESKLEKE